MKGEKEMKTYDPYVSGVHNIRLTFQLMEYKGHITHQVGGNCHGADLLEADFLDDMDEDDVARLIENDCGFALDEEGRYTLALHDADGKAMEAEVELEELQEMLVGIEIVGFIPE